MTEVFESGMTFAMSLWSSGNFNWLHHGRCDGGCSDTIDLKFKNFAFTTASGNDGSDGDGSDGDGSDGDGNDGDGSDGDGSDGDGNDLTLDEWLATKEIQIPDGVDNCKEGIVEHEFVNGAYRIWAGHNCPDKKMILRIKWPTGTHGSDELSTGDKGISIFTLTPKNNKFAIQLGETLPDYKPFTKFKKVK
jgi:hypothetical protein